MPIAIYGNIKLSIIKQMLEDVGTLCSATSVGLLMRITLLIFVHLMFYLTILFHSFGTIAIT